MLSLGHHRLYFLTGKGGTGKTAISVGLARALARRGKRVLLLEVDAPRPSIPSYFGGEIGYDPVVFAPRIEGANLDFFSSLRSYVESVVSARRLVGLVLRNKVIRVFLGATPGARELVLLSRIWEHSLDPRWDHIVVDLPASGHALALFRCPFLAQRTFERGPLRSRADQIIERFSDESVATVIFAALPGEMPINETLETCDAVRALGLPHVGGVLLNRFPDEEFRPIDEVLIDELAEDRESPGHIAHAIEAARETRREQHVAVEGMARLTKQFGDNTAALPVLPGTHSQVADALSLVLASLIP